MSARPTAPRLPHEPGVRAALRSRSATLPRTTRRSRSATLPRATRRPRCATLPRATRRPRSVTLPRAARGLTLIEMLVVLVLVSLLGTLLIQGAGFFLGKYASVQRAHRETSLDELRQHWFASTLQAMVPSDQEARRFSGNASAFEGVTLQALRARSGQPVRVRWSIGGDGTASVVRYEEEDAPSWTVLRTRERGALAFQYAGTDRQWHENWPVSGIAEERIPRVIRLVSSDGRPLWVARLDLFPRPVANYREEF